MKKLLICLLILCLALPVHAEEGYVFDLAGVLDEAQCSELEAMGEEATDCGYYVVTVADCAPYTDVQALAEDLYTQWDLGLGENREGLLLLLSMENRQYALIAHGDRTIERYSEKAREQLAEAFLEYFHEDDWYGGFCAYFREARGVRRSPVSFPAVLVSLLLGCLTALLVCSILKKKMRSVAVAAEAGTYLTPAGVQFRIREDRYTHTTHTRVRIQRNEDHGGRDSGFRGSSGSF